MVEDDDGSQEDRKLVVLDIARREGRKILTEFQYGVVIEYVKRLFDFGDHAKLRDLDIKAFGDFFELSLKGGTLKKINLRVYFKHVHPDNIVLILKAYKKEEDGKTPPYIMLNLEDRLDEYLAGQHRDREIVYKRSDSFASGNDG